MLDPTLTVLLYSSVAAGLSAAGALPLVGRDGIPVRWMGWANALAGGMMMGAAYLLAAHTEGEMGLGTGALVGILFIYWIHAAAGTAELDHDQGHGRDPVYGYQILLMVTLHSAWEGVAIGAAMVVDLPFGMFTALAMAVHNVPEATVLCAVLKGQGVPLRSSAALAVAVNVPQILLAVATFAVVSAAPAALPWVAGFAVGALVHLVLVELLAQSYRQAGQISIALVAAVALGLVVLVEGFLS